MPFKLFPFVAMLILPISMWGQSATPYADLHKRSDVLTLSNGKYNEFFDQDSIQQIGSVLVNVNSMKVVKLLNEEETTRYWIDLRCTNF